ncbi:MAG: hypothetical protein ACK45K_16295, partial [Burkholderiaceae bacterium]
MTSLIPMALLPPLAWLTRWSQQGRRRCVLGLAGLAVALPLHALAAGGLPATVEAALQRAQVPREALSVVVMPVSSPGKGTPLISHRA